MTFRRRRPDDWATNHVRAKAALSDRLDGVLEPGESGWLDGHLATCPDCRAAAAAYEEQRATFQTARAHPPAPPRDLWARTAAAIERESSFRDRHAGRRPAGRRSWLRSPVLASALVVAVAVGTLISSQLPRGGGQTALSSNGATAAGTAVRSLTPRPGSTPIVVAQRVQWISQDEEGRYRVTNWDVHAVCADPATTCSSTAPVEDQPVQLETKPQSAFGSRDGKQLIVVSQPDPSKTTSVRVVPVPSAAPDASPSPSNEATPTSSATATLTASPSVTATPHVTASVAPTASPTATPTGSASAPTSSATPTPSAAQSASPSVSITPSGSPDGSVEIADNVILVGQSASYSLSGDWFAFTARPSDGSAGPDIYVWHVGDATARPATSDHRSVFGSWVGDVVAGSTVEANGADASSPAPERVGTSFLLDPATGRVTPVRQAGRAWRPSVDPTGQRAVYWAGTLRTAPDAPVELPDAGRLVVGDWGSGTAQASEGAAATSPTGDQGEARHETTIAAARIADWDARWDNTGAKLAVWIADDDNPDVGSLSLYNVDLFSGRVDLKKPLLDRTRSTAGFSMADGKLVWADPTADASSSGGRVLMLAWTADGEGTVETLSGKVVVIR